jgi:hypothetical protein
MKMRLFALLLLLLLAVNVAAQDAALTLTPIGTYATGKFDEGAAEIVAYYAPAKQLFVINAADVSLDILDITDPTAPALVTNIKLDEYGDSINSIAIKGDIIAVAVENADVAGNGQAVFLNPDGTVVAAVEVGVLPDMIAITADGMYALTANEGQPSDDYATDPEGSVSIIDLSGGVANLTQDNVMMVSFADFNADGSRAAELPADVRIFGPNATVAQDLEPEYIATADGIAYVTLQENNAVAVIDIATGAVNAIVALGYKDYNAEGNSIDSSDEDGGVNIRNVPAFGMYQPDGIAAYMADGATYLITANEGDSRDYDGFSEEARVEDFTLDAAVFTANTTDAADLGRMRITNTQGDTDGDGDLDAIYSFGARSFTIWGADGSLVFDSGNMLETMTSELSFFNSNGTNDSFDSRSDDKGPEPEGVVVAEVNGAMYAFIGLERTGGVMVFDVTNPMAVTFVTYATNNLPEGNAEEGTAGDIGPEGLLFISAADSPNGMPLLVVANEVSGSTTLYSIE